MRNTTLVAVVVASLGIAGGAEAQAAGPVFSRNTDGVTVAIDLEQQAEAAIAGAHWSDAASMLRTASALRPPNDPVALSDLNSAGALYDTVGQFDEARLVFVELADRATQQDEFATVANAWVDAAHAAAALGDSRSAVGYYERAQQLTKSSRLTSQEARTLHDRLSQLIARR